MIKTQSDYEPPLLRLRNSSMHAMKGIYYCLLSPVHTAQYITFLTIICFCRYGGVTCRTCVPGYFRSVAHCEKCPSTPMVTVWWFIYLLVFSLPVITSTLGHTYWMVLHLFIIFVHPLGLMPRFHIEWPQRFRHYFKVRTPLSHLSFSSTSKLLIQMRTRIEAST